MCKGDMDAVMGPYYAALDSLKKYHDRRKHEMPDDFYVAYLFSFTNMRHMPTARQTVKEWRSLRKQTP